MTQQAESTPRTSDDIRRLAVGRGNALNLDRILVPLNGFRRSEHILPFASMFADWFSGEITLFHSLPSTHPARGARPGQVQYPDAPHDRGTALAAAYLEEVVSRLGPHGVKSRWGVATGDAASMITSRSATSSYGVVAIATSIRSRSHRLISSGLIDNLWRTTSVPLLIVNPLHTSLNGTEPHAPDTIIVPCVRGANDPALSIASAVTGASRSKLKIILSKSSSSGETEDELIKIFADDELNIEIVHGEKDMIAQTLAMQENLPGSWIAAGSKMQSGLRRAIFGSTADTLARQAAGPIVVVPDPKVTRQRKKAAREATRNLASSL
jgi:nucleotide-binding universal stress UspA family protein